MSTNLYWQPKPKEKSKHSLAKSLKFIIAPRYFEHDGSLSSLDPCEFTAREIPFLEGIAAAGNEETRNAANELIAAIKQHGEIWLTIEG